MPRKTTILFILLCLCYAAFSLWTFPKLLVTACIPVFVLHALGAWLYGTRGGLYLLIVSIWFHMLIFSVIYGDILEFYQTKLASPAIAVILIYLMGTARKNFDGIKETNIELDRLVDARNRELEELTTKLLSDLEDTKNRQGENLHDGVGQQLTGVQLLTATLHDEFINEENSAAAITDSLLNHTRNAHELFRRISRILFPIRISEVGLPPALNELSDCLMEIKPVKFTIAVDGDLPSLSPMTELQLYRICQEAALHAIDQLAADVLTIRVGEMKSDFQIMIEHNGNLEDKNTARGPFELIQYRLNQISGDLRVLTSSTNIRSTIYTVPESAPAAAEAS